MIAESAQRLCHAQYCFVYRFDGELLHFVSHHGLTPEVLEMNRRAYPAPPGRKSAAARAVLERRIVQIPDVKADAEFALGPMAKIGGFGSVVGVPILRDGVPVGSIAVTRVQTGLIPERLTELLTTFADQAAIAIENVRLFDAEQQRSRELAEALEQQTATADVLQVISRSQGELDAVFASILDNAVRICGARFANLVLYDGTTLRIGAMRNAPAKFEKIRKENPVIPIHGSAVAELVRTRKKVHILDLAAMRDYVNSPLITAGRARSMLAVPMLKDGELIGGINIYRQEVKPFSEKQIVLLENFAAQAVIAIENARLLNELRQRTDDLTESLEQQTASSEVLGIISGSPGELQPVFDTILENSTRLCEANFGVLALKEGDMFQVAAMHNAPQAFAELRRREPTFRPGPLSAAGRVAVTKQVLHIPDYFEEETYKQRDPEAVALAELAGARSLVVVPMLKDDALIGAIFIYRQEVQPFTDKQIELVKNFAAQAVIAIENARLLNELRQSLEQQTATSEVLEVISSSPGQLDPVFETMLENATRICEAKLGTLFLLEDGTYRAVAVYGDSYYADWFRREPLVDMRSISHYETPLYRLMQTKMLLHIHDLREEAGYRSGNPRMKALVETAGARTHLVVPMLKDEELVGAITIYRTEVKPFSDKQVELVQNFAAQAVIAIENTRLLNELRQRTDDLSEALEQQTSTAEVLKVIASSTGDTAPVFASVLANATQLCDASYGLLWLYEGGAFRSAALQGDLPRAYLDQWRSGTLFRPDPDVPMARAASTGGPVQLADLRESEAYRRGDRLAVTGAEDGGIRTILAVPMLKDKQLIGVIAIYRTEVKPFTDKQIELVKNFAAQAVIAIENARLLNELRLRTDDLTESLEQQTATSEILTVISNSLSDTQPVFDAIVRSGLGLFPNATIMIVLADGDKVTIGAAADPDPARVEAVRNKFPVPYTREYLHAAAILDRRLIDIPDASQGDEPADGRRNFLATGNHAITIAPMMRGDEAIGALSVVRKLPGALSEKQIEVLRTFANQAVIAIENTRLLNQLRERTGDLTESLQQQTATADVLKVISRSTFDLQTVLDTLTESATKLCAGDKGVIFLRDGELLRLRANYGYSPEAEQWALEHPMLVNRASTTGRAATANKVVHIPDVLADPEYTVSDYQKVFGYRTVLSVPLLREGSTIGIFSLVRDEVNPFTDKQIELVSTFADQAVIAIENARLLNELRQRTDDLTESLEYQTATGEILTVISRSPTDAQPVFDIIGERAEKLCDADVSVVSMIDGDVLQLASIHGTSSEGIASVRAAFPMDLDRETITARTARTADVVHVSDVLADSRYDTKGAARTAGYRACLGVPMIRTGQVIGTIFVGRKEPRPYTDSQIQLLKTFADQAVIAIGNVRLFKEVQERTEDLQESLQQQTATADVLKVISRSAFDLSTVLQALIESAARLCDADKGNITREKNGVFYRAAESYGYSREFRDLIKDTPIETTRGSATGRALLEGRVIHIADVKADQGYTLVDAQRLGDYRTVLAVPMLREGATLGVLTLTRSEVRPFTDKQIELVTTFADQAAIAIENVRLFESVEARTKELAQSLEELRTAQDRLVQTEKLASLGQLTAGIAHEIKNPLNFVNNFSGVSVELIDELQETLSRVQVDEKTRGEIAELTDTIRGNLDKIVQHGKSADSIVKNMLLHSREGSGEHRPVDINSIVEESLNLAYHGARAEKQGFNITLERSLGSRPPVKSISSRRKSPAFCSI